MDIKETVDGLVRKFKTNDPIVIAEANFVVVRSPLGSIKGFYKLIDRRGVIFINSKLDYFERLVVCAHELGHAIMHPKVNCSFMQNYTLLSVSKVEIEANKFCAYMLITDKMLPEFESLTYQQIAGCTHIPVEIVKLRQV